MQGSAPPTANVTPGLRTHAGRHLSRREASSRHLPWPFAAHKLHPVKCSGSVCQGKTRQPHPAAMAALLHRKIRNMTGSMKMSIVSGKVAVIADIQIARAQGNIQSATPNQGAPRSPIGPVSAERRFFRSLKHRVRRITVGRKASSSRTRAVCSAACLFPVSHARMRVSSLRMFSDMAMGIQFASQHDRPTSCDDSTVARRSRWP
jgi:hypothetical protein